jgi:hypothetical protein
LSIQPDDRYIAAIVPLFSVLIVCLIWRLAVAEGSVMRQIWPRWRIVVCISAAVYFSTSIAAVGAQFYCYRQAGLTKVINRVASVVGPESRLYGSPVFWVGHKRYRYGPYPVTPVGHARISLAKGIEMVRKHRFDYAVRTAWWVIPDGVLRPPHSMPNFKDDLLVDQVCRIFGTKVDEFYDPYYGPIEIYKLNWDRLGGKFGAAELHRLTVCQTDETYRCYRGQG